MREQWRDKVWRKQVRRVFPLMNADGLIKEIEFRPSLLPDGRLILILSDVTESHPGVPATVPECPGEGAVSAVLRRPRPA